MSISCSSRTPPPMPTNILIFMLVNMPPEINRVPLDDFVYYPLGYLPEEPDCDHSPPVIFDKELLTLKGWIYALHELDRERGIPVVTYVGATTGLLRNRLKGHLRRGSDLWRRKAEPHLVTGWYMPAEDLLWPIERALIEALRPEHNRQYLEVVR